MSAFFEPNTSWDERLARGLVKLAIAACVSLCSGLLFALRTESNPDAGKPLCRTLPVQLFLWSALGLSTLFCATWYLRCGGQNSFEIHRDCSVVG